jgi:hypothetical protein
MHHESTPEGPNPSGLCMCGCGQRTSLARYNHSARRDVKGQPVRYIKGHRWNKPFPEYTVEDRGYTTPCWIWQHSRSSWGYGRILKDGREYRAHRVVYERHRGPIPEGLVLDHLCRVVECVNPDHLDPVTDGENSKRGECPSWVAHRENRCMQGHELTPENTRVTKSTGKRRCRICDNEAKRVYQKRKRHEAKVAHDSFRSYVEPSDQTKS